MFITAQILARRLRAAREACKLTQEQVATSLGVSRPAIVQIEAGQRAVSSLELAKLADLFVRDVRDLLAAEDAGDRDPLMVLFRADNGVMSRPDIVKKVQQYLAIGREMSHLARILGVDGDGKTPPRCVLPPPTSRWEAVQQGETMANEERRRLNLGVGPLPDVVELLEDQGVRAGIAELMDDVSGLTLADRNGPFVVIVNQGHGRLRRRFSFAHEYAHVLADYDRTSLVSRSSEREQMHEVRANAFAATFLMPEPGVEAFLGSIGKGQPSRTRSAVFDGKEALDVEGRSEPGSQDLQAYDLVLFAHYFGVSCIAALYRLKNLRFITGAEFEKLKSLDDANRTRDLALLLDLAPTREEEELDHERHRFRRRFLGLALEACRREKISRGKFRELARMAGVGEDEVEQLAEYVDLREVKEEL